MSNQPNVLAFRSGQLAARTPDVLLGPSAAITRVWSQIRRVSPYFRSALITGERATGAYAVAQALHTLSPMAGKPFTVFSPAGAEAALGGATVPRFSGDVLFFPEIENLSPAAQNGLLRLLHQRRHNPVSVIAAATTSSPEALRPLVSAGAFSAALALQLSALHIALPALRDRREDIPALATHFLDAEARALGVTSTISSPAFLEALTQLPWHGNLDQLQAVLRRALELHPITAPNSDELAELLRASEPTPLDAPDPVRLLKLEQVVQEHIRAVLLRCNGNKLRASEILGISRSTLYRMLDVQSGQNADLRIAI
jgi:DNA-binding NtrC family response regulator